MTPSQKLISKLRDMGFIFPEDSKVERTYAGRHQKANGASVRLLEVGNGKVFNSQYTVTELVQNGFFVELNRFSGDYDIFPSIFDKKEIS